MDCGNLALNEQGLLSTKAPILFPGSPCEKGAQGRSAAEGPFLFSSSLYFAFTCRQFLCLFLPLYSFADLIWKVHSLKSLPGRRWIVSTAQRWCLEQLLRMLPSAAMPKLKQRTVASEEELGMHQAERLPFLYNSAQETFVFLGGW